MVRNLSVGQTQLISFARAVAQGGQIMMLDEATSSVDSITEDLIQKAMQRLFEEKNGYRYCSPFKYHQTLGSNFSIRKGSNSRTGQPSTIGVY